MPHPSRTIDCSGQKFGRLTVLEFAGKNKHRMALWKCRCDCGKEITVTRNSLASGNGVSCGCYKIEIHTTHGHASIGSNVKYNASKTYYTWRAMKARCTNPKHEEYPDYGGRGITVCERWMKFENFLSDMGEAPEGMSIDRENNELGYFRENCRWISMRDQQRNRRNNLHVAINGRTQILADWARESGLPSRVIRWRINNGWPEDKWLSPVQK